MKNVLILGSGFVSKPGIKYLADQNLNITIASNDVYNVQDIIADKSNCRTALLDINDQPSLVNLIKDNDIVVSILPWIYHIKVAKLCLEYRKHLVTTSYVSDEMKKLGSEVHDYGLIFLNEIGLDPGIDHMSAMSLIDSIHSEGGKVLKFFSYCGGLPAPDDNNNPVGYKFSWSPRGVLLAAKNSATFLEDGNRVDIEAKDVFKGDEVDEIDGLGCFEVYPNRDSLKYIELYNLQEAQTFKRGTYRYKGWREFIRTISSLGLLDDKPLNKINISIADILRDVTGWKQSQNLKVKTTEYLKVPSGSEIINKLEWLGLFSDTIINKPSKLDILCELLQEKLAYHNNEIDMVVLQHKLVYETTNGNTEIIKSTLINYGIPGGDTAMARTVSLPMAIGVKLIAEETINSRGILIPVIKEIYEPVLNELSKLSIRFIESKDSRKVLL